MRVFISGATGFIGQVLAMDATCSSQWTRGTLGWSAMHLGLIVDLERGTDFDSK
jgi:hypothetical protein